MKPVLLFIIFLIPWLINGQCLAVPGFRDACEGTVSNCGCATWSDACGNGWIRSHGTPQLIPYDGVLSYKPFHSFYAYMWSAYNGTKGEGMYTNLPSGDGFLANHSYDIRLRIQTTGGPGTVLVEATNTLTQPTSVACCGSAEPAIPSNQGQHIGQYTGSSGGWIDITLNFVANNNYSQLWIYPKASTSVQYNLYVMAIEACLSCDGNIIYNTANVPVDVSRAGTIQAGSSAGSGGSGTVTVQPAGITAFYAVNEINLLPSFQALTTSGSFTALVDYCGNISERVLADSVSIEQLDSLNISVIDPENPGDESSRKAIVPTISTIEDLQAAQPTKKGIRVYPSISDNGLINITGGTEELSSARITVFDQLGRPIMKKISPAKTSLVTLELGYLKNGLYYIEIKGRTGTVSRKIIIHK